MSGRLSLEVINASHCELEEDGGLPSKTTVFDRLLEERKVAVEEMKHKEEAESPKAFQKFLKEKLSSTSKSDLNAVYKRKRKKQRMSAHKLKIKCDKIPKHTYSDDDDDNIDFCKVKLNSYETVFEGNEKYIAMALEAERRLAEEEREAAKHGELGKSITLKIKYREEVFEMWTKMKANFAGVFHYIAKKFDEEISCIMILLSKKIIAIEDTPMKLGIKETDVIDCLIFRSWKMNPTNKENCFTLKIQSEDGKVSKFLIHKLETFNLVLMTYCDEKKVPVENSYFKFHGKKILAENTPFQVNMESESVMTCQLI